MIVVFGIDKLLRNVWKLMDVLISVILVLILISTFIGLSVIACFVYAIYWMFTTVSDNS